jgi:AcrR family transcriptional regulator
VRRVGVSRRALYVHFDTLEELIAVTVRRELDEALSGWPDLPSSLPVEARLELFCAEWCRLSEAVRPFGQSIQAHGHAPEIASVGRDMRRWEKDVVEAVFHPEIAGQDDPAAFALALHHATSWAGWEDLRRQGVDVDGARDAVHTLLRGLVAS